MEIWNDKNLQAAGVDNLYKYYYIHVYLWREGGVCTHKCESTSSYEEDLCDTYKRENEIFITRVHWNCPSDYLDHFI